MSHSLLRERLKKVAKPVSTVLRKASSFMKPTIRTRPLLWSWMTAGTKSVEFAEIELHNFSLKKKARQDQPGGLSKTI